MPRAKDAPAQVGGQIDPYVQRSLQQGKQQAQNRLLAAIQESGATRRTARQESGAAMRTGMQMGGQAYSERRRQAAQAELSDKRAAENERGRREDLEYRRINSEANRKLQRAIADQNVELRRAEMADDLEAAERATDLQLDLATIDIAHKMREGKATRNMMHSMFKTFEGQEKIKQKNITNHTNAKNEYDQTKNIHSQAVTDVGNRLRDDPRMKLDLPEKGVTLEKLEEERSKTLGAVQDQIALKQSKVGLEDLLPENIHKVDKQLSEEDLTMMDIRTAWSVIKGALPVLDERVKEAEDEDDKLAAGFYRKRRLRLNNILVSVQGLINSETPVKNQPNMTVGSTVREAIGPMLNLSMGAEVNELIESGVNIGDIYDKWSESMEEHAPYDVPGLKTKGGQRFLEGINSLLMNQGEIETDDFIEAGGLE